jgi:hypothetical protein
MDNKPIQFLDSTAPMANLDTVQRRPVQGVDPDEELALLHQLGGQD